MHLFKLVCYLYKLLFLCEINSNFYESINRIFRAFTSLGKFWSLRTLKINIKFPFESPSLVKKKKPIFMCKVHIIM